MEKNGIKKVGPCISSFGMSTRKAFLKRLATIASGLLEMYHHVGMSANTSQLESVRAHPANSILIVFDFAISVEPWGHRPRPLFICPYH